MLHLKEHIEQELFKFEFDCFPKTNSGKISAEDFAKSMLCYLDTKKVMPLLKLLKDTKFDGEVSL